MPKIREYGLNQEVGGVAKNERRANGEDLSVGRSLQGFSNAVENLGDLIQKRGEQAEITDTIKKMSDAHLDLSQQWQDKINSAEPGDNTIAESFLETYDDRMSKISDGITTPGARQYYERANAGLRKDFGETAIAGQTKLAGVKAINDVAGAQGSSSSALINDPTSFQTSLQNLDDGVDSLVQSGLLPNAKSEELKGQNAEILGKSAIRGWIKNNPEYAKQQLNEGKWDAYIDGDVKHQMFGEADQAIRAKEIEKNRLQAVRDEALSKEQEVTKNKFIEGITDGTLDTRSILDSNLDAAGKEHYLRMLDVNSKKPIKTDAGTFTDTFKRINLPDGDPNKIYSSDQLTEIATQGRMAVKDLKFFRGELDKQGTREGKAQAQLQRTVFQEAESKLARKDPVTGMQDPDGLENLAKFQALYAQEFENGRKNGKSALQLLTPGSPDYLGKYINQFQKTPQQIMQDTANRFRSPIPGISPSPNTATPAEVMGPSSPPTAGQPQTGVAPAKPSFSRLPGESAASFLDRKAKGGVK